MNIEGLDITWLGHAGFKINNICIDPYKIETSEPADIILITHPHYDHCSIPDIQKVVHKKTVIVAPPDCTSKFSRQIEIGDLKLVKPGDSLNIKGIKIKAVPAYNKNKEFHPKQNEWVGYVITINNKGVYHAGDTDLVPEMKDLNVDIALLPVGGTYTMNAEEAAKAVSEIKTKVAIPMHYGSIVGSKDDAQKFKELVKDAKVIIL